MLVVRPFLKVLRDHPAVPNELIQPLLDARQDERLPLGILEELLRGAIELTGDPDIGLHAGEAASLGDYDILEYAATSCTTAREAIEVINRYIPLISDAADYYQEVKESKVYAWLRTRVPLSRASADFQSASFFQVVSLWLGPDLPTELEIWFDYPAPADLSAYRKIYGESVLRFNAPGDGFVFDASVLDLKLRSADPKLHSVLRRHADQLLNEHPGSDSLADSVRRLVIKQLAGRDLNVDRIAEQLHVSRRTLHRRLREEGVTFKKLADEVRRGLARRYLEKGGLSMGEISFLLGFSEVAAFYRAFNRWEGRTPLQYQKEIREKSEST
jgi:AraC-like DNA-binding protein